MNTNELDHQSSGLCVTIVDSGQLRGVGPGPVIMAADTLNGNSVLDPNDERLGKVDHIMLDVLHGQIAHVVLSLGGFLGVGTKPSTMPWSVLTFDAVRKCFVLGIDKKQLGVVPDLDQNHWLSMADTQWATGIHQYYGSPPYWEGSRNGVRLDSR